MLLPCANAGIPGADPGGPPALRGPGPWAMAGRWGFMWPVVPGWHARAASLVAYFPSRCCGDNHTVFGSYLCAYVRQLMQTSVYDSMYVHLETQG